MSTGHLEIITWLDATMTTGWEQEDEPWQEPSLTLSVGWVLKDTKQGVSLTSNIGPFPGTYKMDPELEYAQVMTIPKGMILKRKKIKI